MRLSWSYRMLKGLRSIKAFKLYSQDGVIVVCASEVVGLLGSTFSYAHRNLLCVELKNRFQNIQCLYLVCDLLEV